MIVSVSGTLLGSSFATEMTILKSFGLISSGIITSFIGGFGGNYLGSYVTAILNGKPFNSYEIFEDSLFADALNIFSSSLSILSGSASAYKLIEVLFTKSLPFISELLSDITSIIYSKFRNKIW